MSTTLNEALLDGFDTLLIRFHKKPTLLQDP